MDASPAPLQWRRVCYGIDPEGPDHGIVRAVQSRGRVSCSTVDSSDPLFRQDVARGVPCATCLSSRESFARWIEAPFSSPAKAAKVFPTLLDIQLPFPLESCSYAFLSPTRTDRKTTRALAVAARLSDIEKSIEPFKTRGTDPAVLDQEALALWTQSVREIPPAAGKEPARRLLVHLGLDHATLVIGRGATFLNAHPMKTASADQIGRLLRAHLAGESPAPAGEPAARRTDAASTQWVWAGTGAADPQAVAALHSALAAAWPGTSQIHAEPATFLARAIAVRALLPGPLRCNLRAGPLVHPLIARRTRGQTVKAALLCLAAGLFLCAANVSYQVLIQRKEARIDQALVALRDRVAGFRVGAAKGEQARRIVQEAVTKREAALRPFRRAFEPSLGRVVLGLLEAGARQRLRFDVMSLSREDVTLGGAGPAWNSAEPLIPLLLKEGYKVGPLKRKDALDDGRIPFTIGSGGARE